jgi:peptidoglycan/LPS O-acetylase OafA/YrhL
MKHEQKKHFQSLDAFRGIAAVMIIIFHSSFYMDTLPNALIVNSNIFVDFFFILSGFVMGYAYLDRLSGETSLKEFVLLRFARLYPLHLFMLLVWVPFIGIKIYLFNQGVGATDPTIDNNVVSFIKNVFLLQGFSSLSWNYPAWSISVEFFTYIIFFMVFSVLVRFPQYQQYIAISIIIVATYILKEDILSIKGFLKCISEFFLGVGVLYLYQKTSLKINSFSVVLFTLLESISLILTLYVISKIGENNAYLHVTVAMFAMLIYIFSVQNEGVISRVLQKSFFQYLGKISYSIYMTHAIIVTSAYNIMMYLFDLKTGGVTGVDTGLVYPYAFYVNILFIVIVLGISSLTYRYIELPWQQIIKKRIGA